MKLSDLFEGFPTGKIRRSVKDTLPIIGVIPEIDNGNLYLNYRFGTTLASALAVANGEHPYNKQIPWHTQQTVAPYTQQELDIVKLACAQSGFTLDMLHDEVSREPDWVNTVSPVAKLPMLESRRLLEAFGNQKLSTDIQDTLPPVIVIPELNSGNNYPQYRFMTVMASIRAIKDGDVPYRKLQPWSNSLAVVGYTPEDIETIRMAAAEAGFAIDEVNSSPSREPDWVNTASPVMKFKMLEAAGDGMFREPKTAQIHNLSSADDKAVSYQDTPTRGKPQIVVVYPGRFQPLHRGHKAVYDDLVAEFGPNVYIATSNKTDPDKSPFDFEDKLRMARAAGIPADKIQLVKNPYSASEITDRFVPENTVLLFAVGEKDMDTDPRFKFDADGMGRKKDGSLSYLQKWPGMHKAETLDQHGYIIAAPTKEFTVLGKPATSATEIRKAYRSADPATRDRIITDLYGKPKPDIRRMFDDKLGAKIDEDQPTYLQNPLDPEGDTNGPGKTGDQWTEGEVVQFPGKYNYKPNDKANVAQAAGNVTPLARRPAGPDLQNFHAAKNIATQIYWEEASFDYTDESAQDLAELYDELEKMGYTTEDATGDDMGQKITHIASKRSYTIGEDELLSVAEAEVWDKPNPVKKHKHLSDKDKAAARARAKRAGRKWPNMVDNIWAARR